MEKSRLLLLLLPVAVVGAGVVVLGSSPKRAQLPKGGGGGSSPRRRAALDAIAEVVPSTYPSAKFWKVAPGYSPDDPKLPPNFTTCGYLPTYVGHRMGYVDGVTRYGVEGLRERGIALGAWVQWAPGRRPRPGDLYGRAREHRKPGDKLTAANILRHVGVIAEPTPGVQLATADSGQGDHDHQAALYRERTYNASTGETDGGVIPGWIDIDRLPPPKGASEQIEGWGEGAGYSTPSYLYADFWRIQNGTMGPVG